MGRSTQIWRPKQPAISSKILRSLSTIPHWKACLFILKLLWPIWSIWSGEKASAFGSFYLAEKGRVVGARIRSRAFDF